MEQFDSGVELLVARQPIFDRSARVAGYELLYRSNAQAVEAGSRDTEMMSAEVIAGAITGVGLERLTEGVPAYLNLTRAMLLGRAWTLFDPRSVVLELLETVEPDAEVIAACEAAVAAGYQIALDDFVSRPEMVPLLGLATIVKVDVLGRDRDDVAEVCREIAPYGCTLLAEKVEDRDVHGWCMELGFDLFQGFHYARPQTLSRRELSVEQAGLVRLLRLLRDDETPDSDVVAGFAANPSLSYKLLRLVNSAHFGGREVHSIRHAVKLAGRDTLARWLGVLFMSSLSRRNGEAGELVHTAVLRARLLEQLGATRGAHAESGGLFMTGLFSTLEPLLGLPIAEILELVGVPRDVHAALAERRGSYARCLELAEALEQGDWNRIDRVCGELGVPPGELGRLYLDSLRWTGEHLQMAQA